MAFGSAGSRAEDAATQRALRQTLEGRPIEVLIHDAAVRFTDLLDGESWWDIIDMTGKDEEWCRYTAALADVLLKRLHL